MELNTLRQISDPATLASDHLRALWYDLHGDWDTAHRIVQGMTDITALWFLAYLRRTEPDIGTASYWYRNAGKPFPGEMGFAEEVEQIIASLI